MVMSTEAVRARYRHDLDVAYGDRPRQVMDLYYPEDARGAPVLVFLHGGGFRVGTPSANGYQGAAALARGALFVSMGYQLTPDVKFPDSCADVEAGLTWLCEHVAERGGDPGRIYLSGHSAGAMLAAVVGLRRWPPGTRLPADLVRGLVLISGMYDLSRELARQAEIVNGASSRYVPRLVDAIERVPEHTIVVVGERDFPRAVEDAHALAAALKARGASVELFIEAGADHFAANAGFIATDGAVFQAAARMMGLP